MMIALISTVHPDFTAAFWTKLYYGDKRGWKYTEGEINIMNYMIIGNLDF